MKVEYHLGTFSRPIGQQFQLQVHETLSLTSRKSFYWDLLKVSASGSA